MRCASEGACSVIERDAEQGSTCGALTDADCAPSQACTSFERCSAWDGKCVALLPCGDEERGDDADVCEANPNCVDEGSCSRPTDEQCAESLLRAMQGQCLGGSYSCRASTEGCEASEACATNGRCIELEGVCHNAGATDAECRDAPECTEFGWCRSVEGVCQAVSRADCEGSWACIGYNECWNEAARCVPAHH